MAVKLVSKARGCFYGQAIGDALGARYEFMAKEDVERKIQEDKNGALLLPILGGGPFRMAPGQVTDDTEMALALARSVQRTGRFDLGDVAFSYLAWARSDPPDIGRTTAAAFSAVKQSADRKALYDCVVNTSRVLNGMSLSNGCLMRISPLAIVGAKWGRERFLQVARMDTVMTNPHPITVDAVRVYLMALRCLLNGHEAREAYRAAVEVAETEAVKEHLTAAARESVFPVRIPSISTGSYGRVRAEEITSADVRCVGYAGLALQIAFWQLLHAETFESALERVIALGGDTDTNACIAGAMLGAHFGEERIPEEWKMRILKAEPRERLICYPAASLVDLEELVDALLKCEEPTE